jgi:hypothetical protein
LQRGMTLLLKIDYFVLNFQSVPGVMFFAPEQPCCGG